MIEGWKEKRFGDCIAPVRVDRSRQINSGSYLPAGAYPIVDQGQGLIAGWTDSSDAILTDGLPYIVFGDHTRIFKYVDFPFALGADGTKLISPKAGINPRFFFYALTSLVIPSRGYSRHYGLLKEKSIPLPPLPEQKKIAAVLLKLQQAISAQDKIIQSLRDLKKSTMEHLFTRGLRGEKTKMTEIGEMPESWDVVRIEDKYRITKKPKSTHYGSYESLAFIPMECIHQSEPYINEWRLRSPDQLTSGTYFEVGNLLLAKITPCFENGKQGVVKFVPNDFGVATTEVIPIKCITGVSDIFFLSFYLQITRVRHAIAGKMEGATGRQRVPVHLIRNWPIPFPSKPKEQKDIADTLLSLDGKVSRHNENKITLQDLFKTTLNKLMTGDIRVGDLDIDVKEVEV